MIIIINPTGYLLMIASLLKDKTGIDLFSYNVLVNPKLSATTKGNSQQELATELDSLIIK